MKREQQMRRTSLLITLILAVAMIFGSLPVFAADAQTVQAAMNDTAAYMYKTVKEPQVSSIGGEWAVLGLARSGYDVPDTYYKDYYNRVVDYVKACKGVLHDKKYTEYSRVTVALSAIGADPTNVGGYNLLTPLGDFDKTIWQGINGPIWALIALDSGNYPMPENKAAATQATRQMYIDEILSRQLSDGGFSLFGGADGATAESEGSDPDITGMALQALAKYQDQPKVKEVTQEALKCLSAMQRSDGGFSSWGTANSESCVQVVVALCELGIAQDDSRFVKNGHTAVDNLLTFYQKGKGFLHTADGSGSNQMAAEQGFYGLVAVGRAQQGKNSLYRMSDASSPASTTGETNAETTGQGLANKQADVKKQNVTLPGKTFSDIAGHKNQSAMEALSARAIINGKTDDKFMPNDTMTRAEFSTIVVKALGLEPKSGNNFSDVDSTSWYAPYVGTAYQYGIVKGTSEDTFSPSGTITKQEAAVMVERAAKLAGISKNMDAATVQDTLAQFTDYVTVAEWAKSSMAFCYDAGILSQEKMDILPKNAIKRCEVAEMLFQMLTAAKLM
ncbi:hypothetical protein Ami103574_10095 [Aminipila butyrica]|uniref:SLH domain-containing protein n=1 Tax=Aminipila butyrica TaxID=433296 RepID=A0A858BUD6_9FIRM|nr:S-layer homology domain-containing protein [Aminipila butyrica]QIB69651.1 hypothetical protein Ami103574_10095 [Aminipila butyrica]